ncbi:hypothetical protein DSL92_06790 [Billgrantia gudaonensis]|uniref:Uncharacterized protein n=1 Tax=Billgrantia gudaonensis TaxID=376427 RepID=A0A432JIJ7_9GAMM|nr:hypothetical protein DSL92_06790 [Halomonas gudaonensis]
MRNHLYSEQKDKEGKVRSGPYAYVNGMLSEEQFYGFKNVGQGKFGEIIYIPAVSKVDEHTKPTGPSALRELVNAVLSKVMEESGAYQELNDSFPQFEVQLRLKRLVRVIRLSIEADITNELSDWSRLQTQY